MSNIKKIIIILCIILLIAIIGLVAIMMIANNNNNNNNTNNNDQQVLEEDEGIEAYNRESNTEITVVTNQTDYYTVKECLGKYYSCYSILFNIQKYYATDDESIIKQAEKDNLAILYNMFDKEYIEEKRITVDNIKSNLKEIGQISVYIDNMYVSKRDNNINVYLIDGKLKDSIQDSGEAFMIILKQDLSNKTFSILPQEYVDEKYGYVTETKKIDISSTSIEPNENNKYEYKIISEENYVKDLFNDLRSDLMNDKDSAFSHLDEEYKTKKFTDIQDFSNYITGRESEIKEMVLSKYQKRTQDNYIEYIMIDQNNKYYIFKENGVMNYTVILDTYTVDLPEFIERYNRANNGERAGLNLQRAFDALNNKDYEYVYNKLDDTFKANNFPTLDEFEEYITENFYNSNTVTYSNYKSSGGLHMYNATITDAENEASTPVTKTFIIKLLDGTDFTMSFNV